jgi:alcohol oxidase
MRGVMCSSDHVALVLGMMYTRGSASDFDAWRDVYGNEGWGSDDLLPLMKNLETFSPAPEAPSHGNSGPLKATFGEPTQFGFGLLDSVAQYDKERPFIEDTNDLKTVDRWSRWAKWIDESTGKRSDTASGYIYNQKANDNLVVIVNSRVKRVLFEGSRAVGLEYDHDPIAHPIGENQSFNVRARKLVVLAAGAFGSPAILERSGIGSPALLKECDIETLVELPGVGARYEDHQLVAQVIMLDEKAETLDFSHSGDPARIDAAMQKWASSKSGILSTNAIDAGLKLRPTESELRAFSLEFRTYWQEHFEDKPDKALMWIGASAGLINSHAGLPPDMKLSLFGSFLYYPLSAGHVHIRSRSMEDPLNFDCGFLNSPLDLEALRWGYKRTREYARRHPMFVGEVPAAHPQFPESSPASVCAPPSSPASAIDPDIVYTREDDGAIDDYIRKNVSTTFHSMGTCPMKPQSKGGVVDSSLNVYGTECLKVADLSIIPSNVGTNTYSTAALIGEKCAVVIAKELGIQLRSF